MSHVGFRLALFVLGLWPCLASAKDICIQLDNNGDVIVLRGVKVRAGVSGPVGGHVALYRSASSYDFRPASIAIAVTEGRIGIGLTEYYPVVSDTGSLNQNGTQFHHLVCSFGSDGKLNTLDSCFSDLTDQYPVSTPESRPAHVIDCEKSYFP